MILQQNDALLVELLRKLHVLVRVEVVPDVVLGHARVRVLKQALGKLGAEDTRDGEVDDGFVELACFNELGDVFETPAAAAHFDVVSCWEGLSYDVC